MKTKLYLSVLISIFLILSSCNKEDEYKTYSCDSEINTWVKTNLNALDKFTLQQVIAEPYEKQKAIFNAISPEKRFALWGDKFANVLSLKWTIEERHHIELLRDFLSIDHFSDPSDIAIIKSHKTRDEFLKTWIYFGNQNLGWSYPLLASLVLRLDTPHKDGFLQESGFIIDGPPSQPPVSNPCKCSRGDDWCSAWGGPEGKCEKDLCEATNWGCGTLFTKKCDGNCALVY